MRARLPTPSPDRPPSTLPAGMRPDKQLIFSLNNHEQSVRVDVRTNAHVTETRPGVVCIGQEKDCLETANVFWAAGVAASQSRGAFEVALGLRPPGELGADLRRARVAAEALALLGGDLRGVQVVEGREQVPLPGAVEQLLLRSQVELDVLEDGLRGVALGLGPRGVEDRGDLVAERGDLFPGLEPPDALALPRASLSASRTNHHHDLSTGHHALVYPRLRSRSSRGEPGPGTGYLAGTEAP